MEPKQAVIAEFDQADLEDWYRLIGEFDDAIVHQLGFFGSDWYRDEVSYFVLRQNGVAIAAAQIVLKSVPLLGHVSAAIRLGPLWQRRGAERDPEIFRLALRELRDEYVHRRGLVLRIMPRVVESDAGELEELFRIEGYRRYALQPPVVSYVVDLMRSLDELRSGLSKTWRYNLKGALARNLDVRIVGGLDCVSRFMELYREMSDIKQFSDHSNFRHFPAFYASLPDRLKPRFVTCFDGEEPLAGLVLSTIGDTGFYLFGATTQKGREFNAGNALHWWVLGYLKEQGYRRYDLGVGNDPGLKQFKSGLAKRNGTVDHFAGRFESWSNPLSWAAVHGGAALLQLKLRVDSLFGRRPLRNKR